MILKGILKMSKLINDVKKNSIKYGSIPFWSWNDKLEPAELRKQIRNMHDLKMNGFFMHARCGLETEYLSDEWFKVTKVCVDEAKKLGMEAWAYDENGWPSGFAGGKLLEDPDNHSVYLKHEFTDKFPSNPADAYAIYAINGKNKPVLTKNEISGTEKYLVVYYCTDSSYVDTMRADITDKFIKETHELYKSKLGDDFGKAMPGFFTDEPQYYRYANPYSKFMEKWFDEEYGYSVFDAIPAIFVDFDGYESYLYDYHKMTFNKFMTGFAKRIYDWASKNGIKITGHGIEEFSLSGQMLCCGSVMPFYRYEHIPGIDYLGRGHQSQMGGKQLGSACAQLGKKKALTETFACCGWDVSPAEIKGIAELQYAGGVNLMCQHLYPYSERGQRKRDYPAHYSKHSAWQDKLGVFNQYFNNLGYILSLGNENANVLVIHPIHTAWMRYRRHDASKSMGDLDAKFAQLFMKLSAHQIPYHFGEESMIKDLGSVDGNVFKIGKCSYDTVVIPHTDTLDDNTVKLLRKFIANGGKVIVTKNNLPKYVEGRPAQNGELDFLSDLPDINDANVFNDLCDSVNYSLRDKDGNNVSDILAQIRDTKYGRIYYFTNIKKNEHYDLKFTVKGSASLCELDLITLEKKPVRGKFENGNTEILLSFDGNRSFVLVDADGECEYLPYASSKKPDIIKLPNVFNIAKRPTNEMTLDMACISYDGKEFSEIRPIERIRDNLLFDRYKGEIWIKYSFKTEFIPKKLDFVCEKPSVIDISVNGQPIEMGSKKWFDNNFRATNIAPFVVEGDNEVVIHIDYYQNDYVYYVLYGNVMESLRNCLNFDTEVECAYLVGDFAIKTDKDAFSYHENAGMRYSAKSEFVLTEQKTTVDRTNLVHDGYPFFTGKIDLSTLIDYKTGDPTVLYLDGRYATCDIYVNGTYVDTLIFSKYLDISNYLKNGKNKINFVLSTNNRNLMGPHHVAVAEPLSVGPKTFSLEGMWNGADCPQYVADHAFVKFGINE